MTGTVTPLPQDRSRRLTPETPIVASGGPRSLTRIVTSAGTSSEGQEETAATEPVRAERMYPHLFDQDLQSGQAVVHLQSAIGYTQVALDAFSEPDLPAANGALAQLAAALFSAYQLTEFNPAFGSVVAFLRRAVLATSASELSRPGLNALQSAIRQLVSNPLLDLSDAAGIVELLDREGWQGENEIAVRILDALIVESDDSEAEEPQTSLFSESAV